MSWKKDGIEWNGKSVIIGDKRCFNPCDEILQQAGYVWEEQVIALPTEEEQIKTYEKAVQHYLNETARSRGYDNCYTCLSYLNSTDEQWKSEATAFNAWRDQVWLKCHEVLNAVVAGTIQKPTVEELLAQLPELDWGVEARTTTAG